MGENEVIIQVSKLLKLISHRKSTSVENESEKEKRQFRNTCAYIAKRTSKDLEGVRQRLTYKGSVISDEARFILGNYDQKRALVGMKLERMMGKFYNEFPAPHLRLEFANVFGFAITLYEMWGWIGETMNREQQKKGFHSWVLCSLVDKFDAYIETIEASRRYGFVDITNFNDMLELRDEVITCLDGFYRVLLPLRDHNLVNYPLCTPEIYSPYDYEYMCGNVISGPYHLACLKYLCVTRVAQMDLATVRTDIIATYKGIKLDFIETLRAPMPENPTSAAALHAAARYREDKVRVNYMHSFRQIAIEHPSSRILHYTHNLVKFLELSGDVRKKKRNVMEKMVHCDRKEVVPHLLIVAIMSAIEAQLLIVLRVHALFVDDKIGMYGKRLPQEVYSTMSRLFYNCTIEGCNNGQNVPPKYSDWLEEMRDAVRKHVREAYTVYYHRMEAKYTKKSREYDDSYRMCYQIHPTDFPAEISNRVPAMIRNLQMEQQELERLIWELCQIRVGRGPDLNLRREMLLDPTNVFYSFCTNYAIPESVGEAKKDFLYMLEDSTNGRYMGDDLVRTSRRTIHDSETVPSAAEITSAFRFELNRTLGDQTVEGHTATDLANIFSNLLNTDIESSNFRTRYSKPKAVVAVIAKKLVRNVIERYINYLERTHDYFETIVSINEATGDLVPGASTRTRIVALNQDDSGSEEDEDEEEESAGSSETHSETDNDDHMEMMLNALDVAAGAVFLQAAHNALRGERGNTEVPEDIIDMFLSNIVSINMGPDLGPDFVIPGENLPID